MSFLNSLADAISSQFNLGENDTHTLDSINDDTGKVEKYGTLGDLAQHFDRSAERRYVEEGYLRKDPYNIDQKQFEILFQQPSATILIKKKMFSSVGDNFRPDFMDEDERLYYKSMKLLFKNKCDQISALEKLSKFEKISSTLGSVPDQLIPLIMSAADTLNDGPNDFSNGLINKSNNSVSFSRVIDRLRKIYGFNSTNTSTTWVTDSTNLFQSQLGPGTGVIEITNFTNFTTTVSTALGSGGFSIGISDPYEAMLITEYDIERAISDATNVFNNSKIFQTFGQEAPEKLINRLTSKLNKIRANRGAGPISIKVDPNTLLGKRVTVILDRIGVELLFNYDSSSIESILSGGAFHNTSGVSVFSKTQQSGGVTITEEYLKDGSIAGVDGIDPQKYVFKFLSELDGGKKKRTGNESELDIFGQLISTIYSKMSLDANSQNALQTSNEKTNYARRKLRFQFLGKLIIQPMDSVHIYINSRSKYDTKILSGLQNMFTGLGMIQNFNNTVTGLRGAIESVFKPSQSFQFQEEKASFVGASFPNYLWTLVRGNFITEKEGTHVFAGVVNSASSNWSKGSFNVSVEGKDNSLYFEQGKINFKPGVDTFSGSMFDPLTAFKSKFDDVSSNYSSDSPDLLKENQVLLGGGDPKRVSLLKAGLGRYPGKLVHGNNIISDRNLDPVTGRITKLFYAPDGLVYKWKEGIGIFTQVGDSQTINSPDRAGNPNIANEPFAGHDIMNVLSLLITGYPYNFETYIRSAQQYDSYGKDPNSKQDASHSFSASLRNDLIKANTLWGNFIPFKNILQDELSIASKISRQIDAASFDQNLDNKIQELQSLIKQSVELKIINILKEDSTDNSEIQTIKTEIQSRIKILEEQVTKFTANIGKELAENSKAISSISTIAGDFDSENWEDPSAVKPDRFGNTLSDSSKRRFLRRQLNYLTRRMSYNVRANEDKNLFIVDDFYDKDYDIIAYEKSLSSGLALFNNEFTNVVEKIKHVSSLLDLEVFCDTQGHIRCRPKQYNRMPSSVFYKMMYLKKTLNIRVFPAFLDDIFNTKLDTLRQRLEIIEDQIRLNCAILDHKSNMDNDIDAESFIKTNGAINFSFISDSKSGIVTNIKNLSKAANPEEEKQALNEFTNQLNILKTTVNAKNEFTLPAKYDLIKNTIETSKFKEGGIPIIKTSDEENIIDNLIDRIHTKSGERIDKNDFFIFTRPTAQQEPEKLAVDTFGIIQGITDKLSERQKVLRLLYDTLKNIQEFKSLDNDNGSMTTHLLAPGTYGSDNIPEIFEHMIEDESYDDYGEGSGARYIIKRSQITSMNFSEKAPPWNSVEVQGLLNPYDPKGLPQGFNGFPGGGNGMVTARAVDYDMWRLYGYREGAPVVVPFLSDPISQCGPFASMLLSRARKEVLSGSITISGNEFMQPGEVVFIEDRGLLFYVTSVKHTFTSLSSFSTQLDLAFGHTPGEYIPTNLDIIGKMIYKNKDVADLAIHRQESSFDQLSLGSLQLLDNATSDSDIAKANEIILNNIIFSSKYKINQAESKNNPIKIVIELRIYYDSDIDVKLLNFAKKVKDILIGKNNGDKTIPISTTKLKSGSIDEKSIIDPEKTAVDLKKSGNSPSSSAMHIARLIAEKSANNKSDKYDAIKDALTKNIVDCYIKIVHIDPETKEDISC